MICICSNAWVLLWRHMKKVQAKNLKKKEKENKTNLFLYSTVCNFVLFWQILNTRFVPVVLCLRDFRETDGTCLFVNTVFLWKQGTDSKHLSLKLILPFLNPFKSVFVKLYPSIFVSLHGTPKCKQLSKNMTWPYSWRQWCWWWLWQSRWYVPLRSVTMCHQLLGSPSFMKFTLQW